MIYSQQIVVKRWVPIWRYYRKWVEGGKEQESLLPSKRGAKDRKPKNAKGNRA
jgi:hypothetical protein